MQRPTVVAVESATAMITLRDPGEEKKSPDLPRGKTSRKPRPRKVGDHVTVHIRTVTIKASAAGTASGTYYSLDQTLPPGQNRRNGEVQSFSRTAMVANVSVKNLGGGPPTTRREHAQGRDVQDARRLENSQPGVVCKLTYSESNRHPLKPAPRADDPAAPRDAVAGRSLAEGFCSDEKRMRGRGFRPQPSCSRARSGQGHMRRHASTRAVRSPSASAGGGLRSAPQQTA